MIGYYYSYFLTVGVAFVVSRLELARNGFILPKNRDLQPFLPNSWNPMNGITLGRVSTDVLVVILWRFDRSGGIYRTVANRNLQACHTQKPTQLMRKAETQTARSVKIYSVSL